METPLIFPDAMICREFCIRLGKFMDGHCYIDSQRILFITPSIWNVAIKNINYSLHICQSDYHFEKDYHLRWCIERHVPIDFEALVEEAYVYRRLSYPIFKIINKNS